MTCRLGVDVGGTFTDIVLIRADGTPVARKVLSSPPHFNRAIKGGISELLTEEDVKPNEIGSYAHGATVATNAIVTRSGAKTGLITTAGFRDVLEIRRMRAPRLYDLNFRKPEPLVPRRLRMEVAERITASGDRVVPLDAESVVRALKELEDQEIESIAVCYLHSYVDSLHEHETRKLIHQSLPSASVSLSSEVLPEAREYERTSTTVINAYVQPLVSSYFSQMTADNGEIGINAPVMVMQSNGGMMSTSAASRFPVHIVESGPAAGVTGVHRLVKRLGMQDAICLDMGGTTAKAAVIEGGEIMRSPEYEVGGDFSVGHRLTRGTGYLLRVPSIDIAEVGAGGGSIAWIDAGGALRVGPQSAGADPGPLSYKRGGMQPTITDANLHLGFTNPHHLAGGSFPVYPELAERGIQEQIAEPLGLSNTEAAWGIRSVANSSLIRALRAVTTERGRDPRSFSLVAFGGMGPVHAVEVATELGVREVIVPPLPGVFSALGLISAEVEHHLVRTFVRNFSSLEIAALRLAFSGVENEGVETLAEEGYDASHQALAYFMDVRYVGQEETLMVAVDLERDGDVLAAAVDRFREEHERTYGYATESEELQVVAVRCVARGLSDSQQDDDRIWLGSDGVPARHDSRACYFGREAGWIDCNVIERTALTEVPTRGPLIVEEATSLTAVFPGWSMRRDEWSNIVVER